MGLLTSPTPGGGSERITSVLIKWEPLLSPILYIGGVVWFLALAYHPYNAGTYFSENALLPGLVTNEFSDGSEVARLLKGLQSEAGGRPDGLPHSWIRARFRQLGLQVYPHTFTLQDPTGNGSEVPAQNTYAVLRASRSGATEALVLSAPHRADNSAALALLVALAAHFRRQVYWAKDIIFLVTEQDQLGLAAWLAAYHGRPADGGPLRPGRLPARAGAIQAAVALEVEAPTVGHVDVLVEGLNGQLPNLDLVKLAHWLCRQEHVQHTTQGAADHPRPQTESGYRHSLQILLSMMASQATGIPSGGHGHYLQYGIQAVTLRAAGAAAAPGPRSGLTHLGRVLEGMFRSLNNLLERFHQSFFFYLLPATGRYISIGLYMPPLALLVAGVLLRALTCWLLLPSRPQQQLEGERPGTDQQCETAAAALAPLLPRLLAPHALGALTLALLAALSGPPAAEVGLLAAAAAGLLLPLAVPGRAGLSESSRLLLLCAALLQLALLVSNAALFNISLALLLAVLYTPAALASGRWSSSAARLLASVCLLLVHPLAVAAALASRRLLTDSLLLGGWLPQLAAAALWPVWQQLWALLHSR